MCHQCNYNHHLSVSASSDRGSKFFFLINRSNFQSRFSPQPSETCLLQFFFFLVFFLRTSQALCFQKQIVKTPAVINKQSDTGRGRSKQKDRFSVALIGTTSHIIQTCRSQPVSSRTSDSLCAFVRLVFFPPLLHSIFSPSISTGQSVDQLGIFCDFPPFLLSSR